ncbi:MAG: hypothetical protein QOH10_1023 [Actinomycetota bacterium]|nr:hypothetical protein [Actinomycetota bacterium]
MSDIETRVRDAITMNVDLMDGPARVVERAVASADRVRRSRRRRRALASAAVVTLGAVAIAGVVFAVRDHGSGMTVTAGSPTSVASAPKASGQLGPNALIAGWNTDCGQVPVLAPVDGLRFTLALGSPVVAPGESVKASSVLENQTAHDVRFGTGIGTWYITTPAGRLVGTNRGYAKPTIGYGVVIPAYGRVTPRDLTTSVAANAGACAPWVASPASPLISPPLPRGHYLAWYGLPTTPGAEFVSEPARFDVGGAPLWNVHVTRAQAIAKGRLAAIDPTTAIVQAKLVSWAEIRSAGAYLGTRPNDEPERRAWAVSISGAPHPGMCCLAPHRPFRWGVVFIDPSTGDAFSSVSFAAGSTGDIAPWFARLPDHGA